MVKDHNGPGIYYRAKIAQKHGNALLNGITVRQLNKLAQNSAARMLTRTRKFACSISHTIQAFLTWKPLHDMAPQASYISEIINLRVPSRQLRSSNNGPRTLSSHGDRAFCSSAPRLWNSLPTDLRLCDSLDIKKKKKKKKTLKTHLFKIA